MITKQKAKSASYVTICTTPFQRGVANRLFVCGNANINIAHYGKIYNKEG